LRLNQSMARGQEKSNIFLLSASLVFITFLVFLSAINHPFVHDDVVFIVQNPHIAHLDQWFNIFTHASLAGGGGSNAYYRPVLEIVYRLEYALFGFHAAGFHAVNLLIHVINGLLIFTLLRRFHFAQWTAYAVSLIFLIHPVQTEAVACVAGISNELCALFMILTLRCYVQAPSIWVIIFFIIAFLTKEQAVVLPLLLILTDIYLKRIKMYQWWLLFGLMTIALLWLRTHLTGAHIVQDIMQSPGELRLRLLAIPRTLLMYLRLLVWPTHLHYYRNTDILASNGLGFALLAGLAAFGGWMVTQYQINRRVILFGLAWFLICLMPVLNIVPLVNEYSYIMSAEHFLYLPMIGILIVAAVGVERFLTKRYQVIALVVCTLVFGWISVQQNRYWSSEVALFERMSQYEPNFGRGQLLLARAYDNAGQSILAQKHYQRALDIMKAYRAKSVNANATRFYDGFIKDIYFYQAQSFKAQGRFNEAINAYQASLALDARSVIALEGLALSYLSLQQYEEAITTFNQALVIDPQNASLLNNLAIVYLKQGDNNQAEQFFKMALGVDPVYMPARRSLDEMMKVNNLR